MELLEREAALALLAEARDAAEQGDGRVVFVTGEPGHPDRSSEPAPSSSDTPGY